MERANVLEDEPTRAFEEGVRSVLAIQSALQDRCVERVLSSQDRRKRVQVCQFALSTGICPGLRPGYATCRGSLRPADPSPLDLYRTLATELGLTPSHRRAQLWTDIKKMLVHLVDERGTQPIVIIDEAQHLSDRFLIDLAGFLNFAFDSRDLLTLWLVGLSGLVRRLRMHQHAPLAMRVAAHVHLEPLGRDDFEALVEHGLKSAGANERLLSEPALELLVRTSRGIPRVASQLLRAALRAAHERDQSFIDEHVLGEVVDQILFTHPTTGRGERR